MLIVIPYIDNLDQTTDTLADALAQQEVGDVRVLLIDQGSSEAGSRWGDAQQLQHEEGHRVLCWHYHPQLSLGAAWNRAMAFAEESGEEGALIINNDIRLHRQTAGVLRAVATIAHAHFVSGIGVDHDEQFEPAVEYLAGVLDDKAYVEVLADAPPGGPDFSCYYFTLEGWHAYPYDEGYWPAYTEDVDMHRRMLLGDDGEKIFGVNLPFRHFASGTINQSSAHRQRLTKLFGQSYAYFERKWQGPPNRETAAVPFGEPLSMDVADVTTPRLFKFIQEANAEGLREMLTERLGLGTKD